MLAKLKTYSLVGIEAVPVDVEVDFSPSPLPKTVLVGLPEQAVRESTHRVERALVNAGFIRPHDRIVINLAPAELPKQAASFDLPISLGMLVGSTQLQSSRLNEYAVVGELSLEGLARGVKGALSMAIAAAKQDGIRGLIVPTENAQEAAVVEDIEVIPVASLTEAAAFLAGTLDIDPVPSRLQEIYASFSNYDVDFSDVRGQEMAKRALMIAAAGNHNLLLMWTPAGILAKTLHLAWTATRCGHTQFATNVQQVCANGPFDVCCGHTQFATNVQASEGGIRSCPRWTHTAFATSMHRDSLRKSALVQPRNDATESTV